MFRINSLFAGLITLFILVTLTACSPEIGSDKWCAKMKATPSGDWTVNQAADFAKHCLLK